MMQSIAQADVDQRLCSAFFARFGVDSRVNERQLDIA